MRATRGMMGLVVMNPPLARDYACEKEKGLCSPLPDCARRALFQGVDACLRALRVLVARGARDADLADDSAVHHDREAADHRSGAPRSEDAQACAAARAHDLEGLGR